MAVTTPISLRNGLIYSVFVRNYSEEGTFEAVRRDLDRIRALGTDIIWLMPVQPSGKAGRKGSLGSPYAISDYRKINPEFGTMDDFVRLTEDIHAHGMKVIIDVVYNHTSPDSWLAQNHPEWFYHKGDGSLGGRVGDWSDVVDLDYSKKDLWRYQIDTLKMWAQYVDGFRCDVAPIVPGDFWQQARAEVETVRPGALWLAESVQPRFIAWARSRGIDMQSDAEMYRNFDICYDYDIYDLFKAAITGQGTWQAYAEAVTRQESIYPANYIKLRCLENHDRARAHFLFPDTRALRNMTAFNYFQKGITMLYNGEESSAVHHPTLFDKDTVDWSGEDITPFLQRLREIKRAPIFAEGAYQLEALPGDYLYGTYVRGEERMTGIFSPRGCAGAVAVDLPDGQYVNLIDLSTVEVYEGVLSFAGEPVILKA
ncbi:MAG: alpha-amylase family glycosyl hydrolase [Lachnospiraceae bacterium]|nr:alpha-amylase family glycosyl hydrolase [Lachnospiraceae bacterium]